MSRADLRAAVEAHPPRPLSRSIAPDVVYDVREIALWIIDHPEEAQYRLLDWWNAPRRIDKPVYFLGFEIELAAYRVIAAAAAGEWYAPADPYLAANGGCPG